MGAEGTSTVVDLNAPAPTAAPAKAPETAAAPAKVPEQPGADRFAALHRKDREVRQRSQAFRTERDSFQKEMQAFRAEKAAWEAEFKARPLDAIKKRGYTYEDLTKAALNEGRFDPETGVKEVKTEVDRLREEIAARDKKSAEEADKQAQHQFQETVRGFKQTVKAFVGANAEKYELTHRYDPECDTVYSAIEEHWNRQQALFDRKEGPAPKALNYTEALDLVESYYEAQIEAELDALPKTKKWASKWGQKFGARTSDPKEEPRIQGTRTTATLTNDMQSSSAPSLLPQATENDRMRRALAKLEAGR